MVCVVPLPTTQQSAVGFFPSVLLTTRLLIWDLKGFILLSLTTYTSCVWSFVVCFLFSLAHWPSTWNILFHSVPLATPKLSGQESHATLRSRFNSSWVETFGETPGISAWADMQGLGNAFNVIILRSQRLWSKASAVFYLSVAREMLVMRSKCSRFFLWCGSQCLKDTGYLVPITRRQRDRFGCVLLSVQCILLSSPVSICLVQRMT